MNSAIETTADEPVPAHLSDEDMAADPPEGDVVAPEGEDAAAPEAKKGRWRVICRLCLRAPAKLASRSGRCARCTNNHRPVTRPDRKPRLVEPPVETVIRRAA